MSPYKKFFKDTLIKWVGLYPRTWQHRHILIAVNFTLVAILFVLTAIQAVNDYLPAAETFGAITDIIFRYATIILKRTQIVAFMKKTESFWDWRDFPHVPTREKCTRLMAILDSWVKVLVFAPVPMFLSFVAAAIVDTDTKFPMMNIYCPEFVPEWIMFVYRAYEGAWAMLAGFAFDTIVVAMVYILFVQFVMLNGALETIDLAEIQDEKEIIKRLAEIVNYHNFLLECVDDFKKIVEAEVFNRICVITATTTVSVFRITTGNLGNVSAIQFSMVYLLVVISELMLIYLWPCQWLINEAEKLSNGIYNLKWYLPNLLSVRKCLIIMLRKSQNPLEITSMGFFSLKISSSLIICKTAYSCYTFLNFVTR